MQKKKLSGHFSKLFWPVTDNVWNIPLVFLAVHVTWTENQCCKSLNNKTWTGVVQSVKWQAVECKTRLWFLAQASVTSTSTLQTHSASRTRSCVLRDTVSLDVKLTTHLHLAAIFSMCVILFRPLPAPIHLHDVVLKTQRQVYIWHLPLQLMPTYGIVWCSHSLNIFHISINFHINLLKPSGNFTYPKV
jgi:hypothetical protein